MELFKNTNFDFLGKKWPFIGASLALSAAGIISLIINHGPRWGIDFRSGAEVRLRFNTEPPVEKIRAALDTKISGDKTVQQVAGKQEVMIVTEVPSDKELNTRVEAVKDTVRTLFGDPSGKLDLNSATPDQVAARLRDPLLQMGAPVSEQQLQDVAHAIDSYRQSTEVDGVLKSFDQLSKVAGVTPQVIEALKKECVLGPFTIVSYSVVGPKIGRDLTIQAFQAVGYALAGMLIYLAFRFEWIYGAAAVIAVFHDTLITVGLFSLLHKEISLTVVAALLTLVGYSMNDTIVVFDRIRENLKIMRREKLENLINISVNQTLSRTVLTSGLTFITALSLWLFGGEVLSGFSLALVLGILVGTYSSVFVASPILVWWQDFLEARKKASPVPEPSGGGTSARPKAAPVAVESGRPRKAGRK